MRLHAPDVEDHPRWGTREYQREVHELNQLYGELREKGTPREQLILDLRTARTMEPAALPIVAWPRDLSLKEFREFQSEVERLSEAELREKIREANEEFERKAKTTLGRRPPPPGSSIRF